MCSLALLSVVGWSFFGVVINISGWCSCRTTFCGVGASVGDAFGVFLDLSGKYYTAFLIIITIIAFVGASVGVLVDRLAVGRLSVWSVVGGSVRR